MADGIPIIQGKDPLGGLRQFFTGFTGSALEQVRNQQLAQQLGGLFPGQNFQGVTDPRALQAAVTLGLQRAKPQTTQQASSVITDPNNPERAIRVRDTFNQQGRLINREVLGEATLAERLGGVAPEAFTQLQKPVAVKIQGEIKDAIIDIANLENIESSFRDEFAQIPFKIGQKITKLKDVFGIPVTEEQRKNLTEFSAWRRGAQREFVVFKKWATGVAAGQGEMKEQIETAFPSGLKDSAIEFRSKIQDAIKVRKRSQQILTDILNSGTVITPKDSKEARQRALSQALTEHLSETGQPTRPPDVNVPPPPPGFGTPVTNMAEFKIDFDIHQRVTKPQIWRRLPPKTRNNIVELLGRQIRWSEIIKLDDVKNAIKGNK